MGDGIKLAFLQKIDKGQIIFLITTKRKYALCVLMGFLKFIYLK